MMSQSRLNSRRIRESAVARQWRANLSTLVDQLANQLADGWALLVEDASSAFSPLDRSPIAPPTPFDHTADHEAAHEASPAFDRRLRTFAQQSEPRRAPIGFTGGVLVRLPAGPPPFESLLVNPYDQLRTHARLVFGTLSFSALLVFGSTWLLAVVAPSLALAILAALVSVVILLTDGLRFAWQTAAGAASNPALVLLAMSAPLVAFLVVANQRTRWQDHRLKEA
jgi:hypothetical protein